MSVPIANIMEPADWQDREMERLEAENAKLREEFDKMDVWHSKELSAAMAEIDKLRELVRDMWHGGMCECGSRGKCASCEYDYPTRMRELGIEVDE